MATGRSGFMVVVVKLSIYVIRETESERFFQCKTIKLSTVELVN